MGQLSLFDDTVPPEKPGDSKSSGTAADTRASTTTLDLAAFPSRESCTFDERVSVSPTHEVRGGRSLLATSKEKEDMTKEPPATLLDAIGELVSPPLANVITGTFRRMELAEEEIAAAKKRHPDQAAALNDTFRHLVPPPLLRNLDDQVYRAHCREILELVATGDDIREGTTAEVIAALAESSQAAPLTRTATLLYIELFSLVFPGKSEKLFADVGPMEPNAYERTQMRELEADLRRKLRTDRGAAQ